MAHKKVLANIILFKAVGLLFIDSKINDSDKTTSREAILQLTSLEGESKSERIFLSIKKDYYNNFILFFKKKYYHDALTIVDYLAVVLDN